MACLDLGGRRMNTARASAAKGEALRPVMQFAARCLLACAAFLAPAASPAPAASATPAVVADIAPVHSLVAAVMEGLGEPALLVAQGASVHHMQLRPSQARRIAEADLVVTIGPALAPWIERPLAGRHEGAAVLTLLEVPGTKLRNHDGGGLDPHAWLDPDNALLWTDAIAAELSRLDPENAARYAANAGTARDAIARAEARATALLAGLHDRPIAGWHDAFGYFAARFGLTMAPPIAAGDATAPGARHLSELRRRAEAGGIACLFPEPQEGQALVERLAEGTGTRVGDALDPEGATLEPGPGLYPALIEGLARTIAECLAGDGSGDTGND